MPPLFPLASLPSSPCLLLRAFPPRLLSSSSLLFSLQARLAPLEAARGLEDPSALLAPVTDGPLTLAMPAVLVAATERARVGSVSELLAAGLVVSSEELARLIPSLSAEV